MKKVRLFLPLLAILFAAAAAFSFNPKSDDFDTVYMVDPLNTSSCIAQTDCTLTSGVTCSFQVKTATCGNITRFKPI